MSLVRRIDIGPVATAQHDAPTGRTPTAHSASGSMRCRTAGRSANCPGVKGRAALRPYAHLLVGWRDLPRVTTEWYCEGVGLARLVREEPAQSAFLSSGTLTMELISWH